MAIARDDAMHAAVLVEAALRDGAKKPRGRLAYIVALLVAVAVVGFVGWVLVFAVHVGGNPTSRCHCVVALGRIPLPIGWLGFLLRPLLIVVGAAALLVALLWFAEVVRAAAGADIDWGRKLLEPCPTCGQETLRANEVTNTEHDGDVRIRRKGTVTICTDPDCEYATASGPQGEDSPIAVDRKVSAPH